MKLEMEEGEGGNAAIGSLQKMCLLDYRIRILLLNSLK